MAKRKMVEIDGKAYVIPSVFADKCSMSVQNITNACEDGRVVGACKDSSGKWIIPAETYKPLELENIRQILIKTLYLKNRPDSSIDSWNQDEIRKVYVYLQQTGYIETFNTESNRIPFEIVLTDKGMKIATDGKCRNYNVFQIGATTIQMVASLITIVQAFV